MDKVICWFVWFLFTTIAGTLLAPPFGILWGIFWIVMGLVAWINHLQEGRD